MYSLYELMRASCGVVVVVRFLRCIAAEGRAYCNVGELGEMGSENQLRYDEDCVQVSHGD